MPTTKTALLISLIALIPACGDDDDSAELDAGGTCVVYPQCVAGTAVCCEQDLPVCFRESECDACCGAPCVAERSDCR